MLLVWAWAVVSLGHSWPDCDPALDGHFPNNGTDGPFGPVRREDGMFAGSPLVALMPTLLGADNATAPLLVFMHGDHAQIDMYLPNLVNYASHGFVVVFPYIKDPKRDTNPLTTNTNGEFILHGIAFAQAANANTSSLLHGRVDLDNVVVAGHSMGATCSIMAGTRLVGSTSINQSAVKLVVAQHPGICGPFGPPPWPATWLKSDLVKVAANFPVLFTTATNDGAFWPAPQTAVHEAGCFNGSLPTPAAAGHPATFVQFSAAACAEDGVRHPFDDSGHDCAFKNAVETPWVLTAAKLYAQQSGRADSNCAAMIYGRQGAGGIAKGYGVERVIQRGPVPTQL